MRLSSAQRTSFLMFFNSKKLIFKGSSLLNFFIEAELEKKRKKVEKTLPPRKKPCNMIEFEGIWIGYGSFD